MATRHIIIQPRKKSGMGFKLLVAALLGIAIVVLGFFLANRIKQSKGSQRHETLLEEAMKPEVTEIPMSAAEYARYLQDAASADTDEKQKAVFSVLNKARANDGSNLDTATGVFITTTVEILPEVRDAFIREVLAKRVNREMVPALVLFARETRDMRSAVSIFGVIRGLAGDDQFEAFLSVAQDHPNADFKKAAEESAIAVLKRSGNRSKLTAIIDKALAATTDARSREILQRIKAGGGG